MKKFLLALLVLGALLTGCTGPFVLTKNLHKWQTSPEDKWLDEVVFLGCISLPVYGLATLGDALIFNSIEFWGGENPVKATATLTGNEMCLRSVAAQL